MFNKLVNKYLNLHNENSTGAPTKDPKKKQDKPSQPEPKKRPAEPWEPQTTPWEPQTKPRPYPRPGPRPKEGPATQPLGKQPKGSKYSGFLTSGAPTKEPKPKEAPTVPTRQPYPRPGPMTKPGPATQPLGKQPKKGPATQPLAFENEEDNIFIQTARKKFAQARERRARKS